jgi:hypothetical protein
MNKDVVYIDVEDDVTAIIGKIKASTEKIIALVPPKRAGVLQSAVNLRLLDRMASNSHKHLVIITNNQALIALTAAAGIPVAKNLQSKPELAEITALNIDDDEDVIDGSSLPIGELERTSDRAKVDPVDNAIDELNIDDKKVEVSTGMGAVAIRKATKTRSGVKVPNFNSFRKKLFLGIAGGILLILFLIWANVVAPGATIVIAAKTNAAPVSVAATLSPTTPTDVTKGIVQTIPQQLKQDMSVKFTATGTKDLGTSATGTVTFTTNSISALGTVIPAGTALKASSGSVFTTNTTVTMTLNNYKGANIDITAVASGTDYNGATGSMTGAPSGISTALVAATSGGTSRIVNVVSDLDIQKATDALNALPTDVIKKQLISQYKNSEVIINDSFTVAPATLVSSPVSGAEATGQATLTSNVTYSILAISKADVELYLKSVLAKQLSGTTNQRVYDDGISKALITSYNKGTDSTTVNITTSGAQVGPNIDATAVKNEAKGKKAGEVQALLTSITGVNDVQVHFSYPWVTTIPNDTNKVDVQFKLTNG